MATTLCASRVVAGNPAVAVLLVTGPGAADFLTRTTLTETGPGQVSGVLRVSDGDERKLNVVTAPPRRTPIAYISDFRVEIDGMGPTTGSLNVTSAGPGRSRVVFSMSSEGPLPAEFESLFTAVSGGFLDGLERAAREQNPAAQSVSATGLTWVSLSRPGISPDANRRALPARPPASIP